MGEAGLASGHRIATVRIGGRVADVVLHGSAGGHYTGDERDAVAGAGRPGECRVVLRADDGSVPGTGRFIVRTARLVCDDGAPVAFDIDVSSVEDLDDVLPMVVAFVGERSSISAPRPAAPSPPWKLELAGRRVPAPGPASDVAGVMVR